MKKSVSREINKVTGTVIAITVRIIVTAFLALIMIRGIRYCYDFGHDIFYVKSVDPEPGRAVSITIREGTDTSEAAELLDKEGLIDNKISFIVQAKFFDYTIKPGRYILNTSQTSREMLEVLDAGTPDEDSTETKQ